MYIRLILAYLPQNENNVVCCWYNVFKTIYKGEWRLEASFFVEIAISVVTLVSAWFIGNKSVWGQRLALCANAAWWFYVIRFQRWGLAPMQVVFTIMTIRNLIKWEKEEKHHNIDREEERNE